MALVSSNYLELARRIPDYRLRTLPHAQWRSQGRGAHFSWEATETGEESAPYGHWVDERIGTDNSLKLAGVTTCTLDERVISSATIP